MIKKSLDKKFVYITILLIITMTMPISHVKADSTDYLRISEEIVSANSMNVDVDFFITKQSPDDIDAGNNGFIITSTGDATWEIVDFYSYFFGMNFIEIDTDGPPMDMFIMTFDDFWCPPVLYEEPFFGVLLNIGPGSGEICFYPILDNITYPWEWTGPSTTIIPDFLDTYGDETPPHCITVEAETYLCGDANEDGVVDIDDAVYLITYVFSFGPAPDPVCIGDSNGNVLVDIDDVVYLINYIFGGGPAPVEDCCDSPSGYITDYGGCKDYPTGEKGTPQEHDCIEYYYDRQNTLLLTHINAGFNCCPEHLLADITIENNVITIDEYEILMEGGCPCLCLFDINYEFNNIPPGTYMINVIEPRKPLQDDPLQFIVHLYTETSGDYCVERTDYPWTEL